MDPYLDCLYNYITERQLTDDAPRIEEIRALLREEDRILTAFEATLSP